MEVKEKIGLTEGRRPKGRLMRFDKAIACAAILGALPLTAIGVRLSMTQARPDKFVGTIERLKSSVAPIVCVDVSIPRSPKVLSVAGTAVFIDSNGAFLTAKHVLAAASDGTRQCPTLAVYLPIGEWELWLRPGAKQNGEYFLLRDCVLDAEDLAACKIVDPANRLSRVAIRPVLFETAVLPEGTPVAALGFMTGLDLPMTSRATIAGYAAGMEFGPKLVMLDKAVIRGFSGGPVYTEAGHVIGIAISNARESTAPDARDLSLSFALNSVYVRRFLDSTSSSKRPLPESALPGGMIAVWRAR